MKTRIAVPVLLLATGLTAQYDKVHLTDGKVIDKAKVTSWTVKTLTYTVRGRPQEVANEKVFRVEPGQSDVVKAFKDAKKAGDDDAVAYQEWLKAAKACAKSKKLKAFEQVAIWKAYEIARRAGTDADRKECLDLLAKASEGETAYWPMVWNYRLEDSRLRAGTARKQLTQHKKLVGEYKKFVAEKGMTTRYEIEADLWQVDAEARLKEINAAAVQARLQSLLTRAGSYPDLANRINLDYANAVMAGDNFDEAQKLFTTIYTSKVADAATKARAIVGRGHTWFRRSPRSPDNAKRALMDYMRVTILFPEADIETVGEALYHAIQAYREWNGPDAPTSIRRLRSRLKIKYGDSSWAKRK